METIERFSTGGSWVLQFFFFNDTATTEIYTLSLHDALPISTRDGQVASLQQQLDVFFARQTQDRMSQRIENAWDAWLDRSEEHTSELQSRQYLVCRLLLEKKITALAAHHPFIYMLPPITISQ